MKLSRPPRPPGPPLPPPPNIIFSNHALDMPTFSKSIESEKEKLYNNFLHSHVLNFYEYALQSERDASKRVKCDLINLENINYLFLHNENVKQNVVMVTKSTTISTTWTTKYTTSAIFSNIFELDLLPSRNRTKTQLKSISVYRNKKLKKLEIDNETVFRFFNTTNSNTNLISNTTTTTTTTQNIFTKSTNFHQISKENNDNSNLNDLFDQIYSNQAMFVYKMLLIPSVILVLVLLLACVALITKNYKARNKRLSTSSTSSFIACYGANTLVSSAAGISTANKVQFSDSSSRMSRPRTQFSSTNSYSTVSNSSGPIKGNEHLATISNFYSIGTLDHSSDVNGKTRCKNNGEDSTMYLDSICSDNDYKNYEVCSYYPKMYSLSTFGRNEEFPKGSTPIKTSINTQFQTKNSELIRVDSSNVKKSTSKIFPRTNPLYSRSNGPRCKTPDANYNNSSGHQTQSVSQEIVFDICSRL